MGAPLAQRESEKALKTACSAGNCRGVPLRARPKTLQDRVFGWWAHKGSNLGPLPCEPQSLDLSKPNSAIVILQKSLDRRDLRPYRAAGGHSRPHSILCAPVVPPENFPLGHKTGAGLE